MNFTYVEVEKWINELGMTKQEALNYLRTKFGNWFDKEELDHKENFYSNNIRNDIDLEESKKIYAAIRLVCMRTEPEKTRLGLGKGVIDCDKTLWGKYL